MNNEKFKFSVIIPIYNVEGYLEETIESVVNQSIGFEDNIELVLINDGSPDDSEKICLKYKNLYPDNVIYYKQKNSGVSVARNKGIELATGELITFLDSDDKWTLNTFEEVYRQKKKNPEIKLFSCKMRFFDATSGPHPLNYKYRKNRIINIFEDYIYPQLSSSSVFISTDIIKKYQYNKDVKYAEDVRFINEIIFDIGRFMVLSKPIYYYRKRKTGNSAIQTTTTDKTWYFDSPNLVYKHLFNLSKEKFGSIIPYTQYLVMYDLQWRIKIAIPAGILDKKEQKEYVNIIKNLLKDIDDEIIAQQRNLFSEYKLHTFFLKYGKSYNSHISIIEDNLCFDDKKIINIKKNKILTINVINLDRGILDIIGQVNCPITAEDYEIFYTYNGQRKKLNLQDSNRYQRYSLDKKLMSNKTFRIKISSKNISKEDISSLKFEIKFQKKYYKLNLNFSTYGRLTPNFSQHYIHENSMLYNKNNTLKLRKKSLFKCIQLELVYFLQLLKNFKLKVMIYRYITIIIRLFLKKEIWLISDRTTVANDNGMHLFKYVNTLKDKKIKTYFVIKKESADFQEMKKYGHVVNYNSFKYKILFLLSSKIISSQADGWVINAFGKKEKYYRDLYCFDFVFLQHGITRNDQTSWLNVINKNIKLLVTTAKDEYESFIHNPSYGYDKNIIKLIGFPRYDNLKNDCKKIIAIMPTWRQFLGGKVNEKEGIRDYNEEFKQSDYFNFYNNLINDKEILEVMKEKDYKGIFVIHPSHVNNAIDFQSNDLFEIVDGYADYQKIFKEANLLLTDYSSVSFDFAYLYKPVIYAEFDKKEFYENHIFQEGYFKTEKHGFGPVTTNYEDTKRKIITYLENNCKLEKKYKDRIDKFYTFHDQKNCKRVYDSIKKI